MTKIKVGVLTFHDGINHGGFFQAFALCEFLKLNSYDAYIINYKNRKHFINEYLAFLLTKNIAQLCRNLLKIKNFRVDQKKMNLYPKSLICSKHKLAKFSKEFHYIVVGSDIVWDHEYSFTGFDSTFFGSTLKPQNGLIAYAPSMGRSKELPYELSQFLYKFTSISVRDKNSQEILRKNLGHEVPIVLDPTLLINPNFFDSIESAPPPFGNYILIYAYLVPKSISSEILIFAKQNNLKIVSIGYPQQFCDINKTTVGPSAWLSYFKYAKYIITSTFHGSIFSIIFKKKFVTINNYAISNKVVSLLSDLKITSRICNDECNLDISEKLLPDIDWDAVLKQLATLRDSSSNYLLQSLEEGNSVSRGLQ